MRNHVGLGLVADLVKCIPALLDVTVLLDDGATRAAKVPHTVTAFAAIDAVLPADLTTLVAGEAGRDIIVSGEAPPGRGRRKHSQGSPTPAHGQKAPATSYEAAAVGLLFPWVLDQLPRPVHHCPVSAILREH